MKLSNILTSLTLTVVSAKVALGAPLSNTAKASKTCVAYPAADPEPIVAVCESLDTLEFRRGEERTTYDKEQLTREVHELLSTWLREANFPLSNLCQAKLDLWLSVPESNPLGSQLRLEVENNHMPFVVYLAWERSLWKVDYDNVAILPEKAYPESFGYRVANILVKRRPHISQQRLNAYLLKFGLHSPSNFSHAWFSYRSDAFGELETLAELNADLLFSSHLENATLNPVVEWIASRVKAFSFTLPCQPAPSTDDAG